MSFYIARQEKMIIIIILRMLTKFSKDCAVWLSATQQKTELRDSVSSSLCFKIMSWFSKEKEAENVNAKNINNFKFVITEVEQRQQLGRLHLKSYDKNHKV